MKLEALVNRRGHAVRIAALYAAFCVLGGLVVHHLLKNRNSGQPLLLDIAMGVLFLLATTLVIYRLCQRREGELREAHRRLNRELRRQQRHGRQMQVVGQIFNATRDGILMTDRNGRIQTVNRAFCTISGYSEQEAVGRTPRILQSGFYDAAFYAAMWKTLTEKHYWEGELWNRRQDGSLYAERLSITAVLNADHELQGYIGILSDISERKRAEERIHHLANYSSLSGLPNRNFLVSRGQEMLRLCADHGLQLAACHIDLDHFTNVNDALGQAIGDTLLKQISDRFAGVIRSRDVLCHWGSDEFALLLPEADQAEAARIAERLLAASGRSYRIEGRDVALGASIGISLFPLHATDIDELLSRAASACRQAKLQGRNTIAIYENNASSDASQQLRLGSALRGAVERNEFELVYQPQVDLRQNRVIGFEALLRWRHPELGTVPPDRFIPIAESHGLMGEIGDWVLQRACRQARQWLDEGMANAPLAVNISAIQLRSGDLHDKVGSALRDHCLPPELLELELTESLLLDDVADGLSQFDRLKRSLGVKLAVDDFGTGYSNLSFLGRFPADRLKIDRSFIAGMHSDERASSIVATIIQLGHNLGFRVIAEGVETAHDRELLQGLGCDEIQGYLIGRPMPAAEVLPWWQAFRATTSA